MEAVKWADVQYHRVRIDAKPIRRFLNCVRTTHANGGALLACFEPDNPLLFELASRLDMQGMDHLFVTFLNSPSVKSAVPKLKIIDPSPATLKLHHTVPLGMEGELTSLILCGGAYRCFEGTVDEARTISRDFVAALVHDRLLQVAVASSKQAWTEWFGGVVWDNTYILYDSEVRRFWLLCITDTD